MGRTIVGAIIGICGTVALAAAAWMTVVYSGTYNVAATDQHSDVVRWSLDTTLHRSVAGRAGAVDIPDSFTEAQVADGAKHYSESCVYCHGAPGEAPAVWSRGMRPEPPHLTEPAAEWTPAEIHWIVAHGLKMTGMPAFGPHHDADEIMALTAFVSGLPGPTAEDYTLLTRADEAVHDADAAAPAAEAVDPDSHN